MKELLLQYAEYNAWANKLIIDSLSQLGEAEINKEITSSFPSLKDTVYHTLGAEYIWLQRLQLAEHPVWLPATFEGTFAEACTIWQQTSQDIIGFIKEQYRDNALEHKCEFNDRKGVPHKMAVYQILLHVFNHATYHRGQLVTMLRQVGVTSIPGTDFIGFAMKP